MPRRKRFFDDATFPESLRERLRKSSQLRMKFLRKLGPYPVRYYDAMKRMGVDRRTGFKLLDKELGSYVVIWRDTDQYSTVWVQRNCRHRKPNDIKTRKVQEA